MFRLTYKLSLDDLIHQHAVHEALQELNESGMFMFNSVVATLARKHKMRTVEKAIAWKFVVRALEENHKKQLRAITYDPVQINSKVVILAGGNGRGKIGYATISLHNKRLLEASVIRDRVQGRGLVLRARRLERESIANGAIAGPLPDAILSLLQITDKT